MNQHEVSQTYCFDKVNYDVTDSVIFVVPMAGGNRNLMYVLLTLALLMMVAGIWMGISQVEELAEAR